MTWSAIPNVSSAQPAATDYWAILEQLFIELVTAIISVALSCYRVEHSRDTYLASMFVLADYPFANRLYPGIARRGRGSLMGDRR